ncbi:MAG: EAL domain-containing response regulator [Betaproteobacteria bacterium]|nr:EAL domain-containing response regulator [Betaproteobacteria bacterium]
MQIQNLRFLIVEDHGFQRWELGKLLEDLGAQHVFTAEDGRGALTVIQDLSEPVDIIITDLDMPGMDGMEFIRHVGELGGSSSVILVSALEASLIASVGTMVKMYKVNLLGMLEKPLTAKKLAEVIALYQPPDDKPERVKPVGPVIPLREIGEGLRNHEFVAYFQPKVTLATQKIIGAEALARWRHPDKGLLSPVAFIASMEQSPMIDDLTWLMLAQSAEACGKWREAGFDITVSVNLSASSLGNAEFADRVTDMVQKHRLEPRHMILEITESAAATDVGRALENLSRLRMKGFGLSIDDYGTGYSSMQQLTRIAFTELKIDQSFVRDAPATGANRAVLESSLDMSQRLKLSSIAEGIETREEWRMMLDLGCEHGQGYYIAVPMQADAFLNWARKWQEGGGAKRP